MNGVFSPCSDDSIHGPTLLRFPPIGTATPTHLDPFRPISTHFDPLGLIACRLLRCRRERQEGGREGGDDKKPEKRD